MSLNISPASSSLTEVTPINRESRAFASWALDITFSYTVPGIAIATTGTLASNHEIKKAY